MRMPSPPSGREVAAASGGQPRAPAAQRIRRRCSTQPPSGPGRSPRRGLGAWGDDPRVTTLSELASAGNAIVQTSSKSQKVRLLAQFLTATSEDELPQVARYFGGSIF